MESYCPLAFLILLLLLITIFFLCWIYQAMCLYDPGYNSSSSPSRSACCQKPVRDLVLMSVGLSPAIVTKTPLQQAPIPHHPPQHCCHYHYYYHHHHRKFLWELITKELFRGLLITFTFQFFSFNISQVQTVKDYSCPNIVSK